MNTVILRETREQMNVGLYGGQEYSDPRSQFHGVALRLEVFYKFSILLL